MDTTKLTTLLKRKYAEYQQYTRQAQYTLADLREIAEASDLKAEEINKLLGVQLFDDEPKLEKAEAQ